MSNKTSYTNGKGDEYTGDITRVNGRITYEGQGILKFSNGNIYTGTFVNGKMCGEGILEIPSKNNKYVGTFKNNLYNGFGKIIRDDGLSREGNFINGKMQGIGYIKNKSFSKKVFYINDEITILPKNYDFDKLLGIGAFGLVYHAFDTLNNKDVTIKILNVCDTDKKDEIMNEYEILKILKCEHPNVVCMLDSINDTKYLYIVLTHIKNCKDLIDFDVRKLSLDQKINICHKLIDGLLYIHNKGVLHLDIKLENCLITEDAKNVILIDFGLSCIIETTCKNIYKARGTPIYVSPEMIISKKRMTTKTPETPETPETSETPETPETRINITYASDVYSLGILFYILFTCKMPPINKIPAIVTDDYKFPILPEFKVSYNSLNIYDVVLRMTEFDQNLRPRLEDLKEIFNI